MQKFLKHTSLVLILAMVMSMFAFSALADDASKQTTVTLGYLGDGSVERTQALGILSNSYLALPSAEKVTRAQFVDWTVKALNMSGSGTTGYFADVPDDYWAADSINTACGLNLISKSERFNPDTPITLAQAQKILVCAVGYEPAAQQNGGWPAGYVSVSSRLGITKNISQTDSDGISRFDAIKMLDNILEVKVMKTDYNGVYEQSDETVLSMYLDVDIVNADIVEVIKKDNQIRATANGSTKLYNLADSVNAALVVEDEADLYIREINGRDTVLYIDYNGSVTVMYDYITEVNESENGDRLTTSQVKKIYLQNEDKEYKTDSNLVVTLNDVNALNTPVILSGAFAKVVMRSDKVYKIEAYSLYEGGVLRSASPDRIKYTCGDVNDNVMEKLENIDDFQIYIDGKPHTNVYDLKHDMVFDYYISPDEDKLIIVASSRTLSKKLDGSGSNSLYLDGVEYSISPQYGLYVYSNTRQRYQKDASFDNLIGKTVTAFVDDNMYVRYIRVSDSIAYTGTFVGVVMATATDGSALNTDGGKLKIFKLSDGDGEKEYEVDAKKMKNSPIKMDYIRANAGSEYGKSFFRFTTNSEGKITRVEPVDMWGNVKTFSGTIGKLDDYIVDSLYVRRAKLFAAFNDNGTFRVKVLDWDLDMRDTTFEQNVSIISDYDPINNPKPTYVMFGKGSDGHRSSGSQSGVVTKIRYIADNKVSLVFDNTWGNKSYVLNKEDFEPMGLKEGMLVDWFYAYFGDVPISIRNKRDTTIEPDDWVTDNANYTPGSNDGFYRADKILYRDGSVAQFMVNGEPTDIIPLNDYVVIYELVHEKNGTRLVQNRGKNPLGYINQSDNVWFTLLTWGPSPRSVGVVIYEKNGITGN